MEALCSVDDIGRVQLTWKGINVDIQYILDKCEEEQ